MSKRYFIAFICFLMFIVGSQTASAQQQIALDTHAIFQQSCLICHGPDGAYKEIPPNGTQRTHRKRKRLYRETLMPLNCISGS